MLGLLGLSTLSLIAAGGVPASLSTGILRNCVGLLSIVLPLGLVWRGVAADSKGARATVLLGLVLLAGNFVIPFEQLGASGMLATLLIDNLTLPATLSLILLILGIPSVVAFLPGERVSSVSLALAALLLTWPLIIGASAMDPTLAALGLAVSGSAALVAAGGGGALGHSAERG